MSAQYWHLATTSLRHYAAYDGRASRTEFWLVHLLCIAIFSGLLGIAFLAGARIDRVAALHFSIDGDAMQPALAWGLGIVAVVVFLVLIFPLLAVSIRRFHDLGLSGYYLLPYVVIGGGTWWGVALHLAYLVAFCWPGQSGENAYGVPPDPHFHGEKASA